MKYSIRNFLLVFILSLTVFIAAAFFCVNYVEGFMDEMFGAAKPIETGEVPSTAPDTSVPPETSEGGSVEKKDSLSFLLIGKDDTFGNADMMLLVKIDKLSKTIMMTSIPADSRVFFDGEYKRLCTALSTHDEAFLAGKVRAMTGINVDYYISVNSKGFIEIIDAIGGISYYVQQDMYYSDPLQDLKIDLKRGQQTLYGKEALDLLRFKGYASGDTSRTAVQRKFIAAFFQAFFKPENATKLPEIISVLYNNINTSFNSQTLIANSDIIFSLSEYTVKDIAYPGSSFTENDVTYFTPNVEKALELYTPYR
ncbi:MAG: LytR family transcriptional regulator [Ruminococcaceae bacterium]|nr:LytR family transcriptional regulator [Oscillospiraceae bacterium]